MHLIYKSWLYKLACVIRFFIAKLFHFGKFKCPGLSMIGINCGIYIAKKGQINCRERIIINDHVMLYAIGNLSIGKRFSMNKYSRIVAHESICIGDHVTIGQMVSILDHDHRYIFEGENMKLNGFIKAAITIGNNIWIGDKVTILKGVNIGNNVVVAANTVVNKDVPDNCIIAGVPFKIVKQL